MLQYGANIDLMRLKKQNKNMKVVTVRNVPDDLHKAFKIICAEEDTSINSKVIELMREYVDLKKGAKKSDSHT